LPESVSMESLGVSGVGHELWVNDVVGGDRITALVAFLLALDDKPASCPASRRTAGPDRERFASSRQESEVRRVEPLVSAAHRHR
jgi:hypothetical protein